METTKRLRQLAGPVIVVLIFIGALWLLYIELRHYRLQDIRRSLEEVPSSRLWLAVGLTALNYVILVAYDALAVRSIQHPLSLNRIALASFTGFVTSYNFGALLGGTSVRYRLYSAWGLSAVDIVRLVLMLGFTFWFGIFALGGVVFLLDPFPIPASVPLPFRTVRPLGVLLLGLTFAYVTVVAFWRKPIRFRETEVQLPGVWTSFWQLVISATDLVVAAAVLFVLLPDDFGMDFFEFLGVYLLAVVVVIFSHVPGGVGVFELMVLKLAGSAGTAGAAAAGSNESFVAALLVFRGIYYLLPLLIAALLLVGRELLEFRPAVRRMLTVSGRAVSLVAPTLIAAATFAAGAVMLLSGSLPMLKGRLAPMEHLVPLPLLEVSHFLGSLIGAALLLLSRGLQRRLDSAWWLTTVLLVAGIVFSLLRGLEIEDAIVLAVVLGALLTSRRRFYRKGSLIHARFTRGWTVAIILVSVCSIWLGLFAHRHMEYSSELWWKFAFGSHAPRFLRATAGANALLLIFAARKLLTRQTPPPAVKTAPDLQVVASLVRGSPRSDANLALLGDKSFLFNKGQTGFIMYASHNRSWVAMGDPVAVESERDELAWQFRELVDSYDGWPVFYQVSEENLPIYLDQGLTLLKLGDEARVRLDSFDLEGGQRRGLRQTQHRLLRENCVFEVVPREKLPAIMPELKAVSDSWLAEKKATEKGFSLGFFDEAYLQQFPCAVVRQQGELIAFANVWEAAQRAEVSIDLMRYCLGSPASLMEFLFIELMLWGKARGYGWFNLGVAPLSGIEDRPLAPLWNRAAGLMYRHGEDFFSFQGLRQYKEKFDPIWKPKYLASPGGMALPRILADISLLINRGRISL